VSPSVAFVVYPKTANPHHDLSKFCTKPSFLNSLAPADRLTPVIFVAQIQKEGA
jgi:hypothetical protein